MIRLRLALLFLGLSATVAAAQQPAAPVSTPLVTVLLPFVADENFAKELNLTADQIKKLVAHRQKQWDEQYTTAPANYATGVADQTTVTLFKDVLSAEQHKRAVQLAANVVWNSRRLGGFGDAMVQTRDFSKISTSVLARYAEIVEALNLTDEQKKVVTQGAGVSPFFGRQFFFLTSEQSKAAKHLLGEAVKSNWKSAFDTRSSGRLGGGIFGDVQGPLGLIDAKDVRNEIALTDEQVQTLAPVLKQWQAISDAQQQRPTLSPEMQAKQIAELTAATDKALAATLKPEQLIRLRQIEQQVNAGGNNFVLNTVKELVPLSVQLRTQVIRKALAVTGEQDKALAAADKTNGDAIIAAISANGPVEDAIKAIAAAKGLREKAYAAVLTVEQTKKLADLLGKPFTGNVRPDGIGNGPQTEQLKMLRSANFGQRAIFEITLLARNQTIQDELKLSPGQVTKAIAALEDSQTKFQGGIRLGSPTQEEMTKDIAERAAYATKVVDGVLTADQSKRYRELMLQRAEFFLNQFKSTFFNTNLGAVGYPGVAEAVKLSPAQKAKLLDGDAPGMVLTADQKAAIKNMLGKEFQGDFAVASKKGAPFPAGGFGLATSPTTAAVLLNVSWDVFKLTPEQVTKLAPVVNEYQRAIATVAGKGGKGGLGGSPVDASPLAAANDKLAKALADILTPEQAKRVEQVRHQLFAARSALPTHLTNAEVAKALDMKDTQRTKIAAILNDYSRLQIASLGGQQFGGGGPGTQEWLPKLNEMATTRALAVLTDEQRATWNQMTGDPVPNLTFIRGGFGGGFGGGGFPSGF